MWLVNASQVKQVPGRPKADKLDAVWLAKLAERGMLRPSFVPPPEIRQLRDYTRLSVDLTNDRSRVRQRMEKLLEDALIKLSTVATDIFGVSGRAMIAAVISGAGQLAAYATCPVTLIRGVPTSTGAVIVGVEGGERDRAALEHAFRFASLHHLPLHALHTYRVPTPIPSIGLPVYPVPGTGRQAANLLTRNAIAPWTAKFPDVHAEPTVTTGHPAATLVDASRGAALLVVGGRGLGGFAGLLLGSVSQAVLRHAHCPVTVAR